MKKVSEATTNQEGAASRLRRQPRCELSDPISHEASMVFGSSLPDFPHVATPERRGVRICPTNGRLAPGLSCGGLDGCPAGCLRGRWNALPHRHGRAFRRDLVSSKHRSKKTREPRSSTGHCQHNVKRGPELVSVAAVFTKLIVIPGDFNARK